MWSTGNSFVLKVHLVLGLPIVSVELYWWPIRDQLPTSVLVIFLTALIKYPNKSNLGRTGLSGISAWRSSPSQRGSCDDRIWSDCIYSQEAENDGCSNSACLLCLLKIPFIVLLGNWLHANIVYWSYPPHHPFTTPRHLQYVLLETSCSLPPPPPSSSLSLRPISAACYNTDCSWLGPGSQSYSEFMTSRPRYV